MIISGKHRSFDLAERHLSALRREYGKKYTVTISSRRNGKGELSTRGHYFNYSVRKKEPKKKGNRIYLCSIHYKSEDARKNRSFRADVVIITKDMRKPRNKAEEDKVGLILSRVAAEKLQEKEYLADWIGFIDIVTPDSSQECEISWGEKTTKPESAEIRSYVKY